MQEVLLEELRGENVEYSTRVGESTLARVHFVVHTDPYGHAEPNIGRIQDLLADAVHTWDDRMIDEVDAEQANGQARAGARHTSEAASEVGQRYAASFPEAYKEDFTAADGLVDLRRLESLVDHRDLRMSFYTPSDAGPEIGRA